MRKVLLLLIVIIGCVSVQAQQAGRPRQVATKPANPCNARDFIAASDTGISSLCNPLSLVWEDVAATSGGVPATRALDNLASVAINTSLLPGVDNSINLGSGAKRWADIQTMTVVAGTSIQAPFFRSAGADVADAGAIRLDNGAVIGWESNPTGTDFTLGVDTSNILAATKSGSGTTLNVLELASSTASRGQILGFDTTNKYFYFRQDDAADYGWQFQTASGAANRLTITNGGAVTIPGTLTLGGGAALTSSGAGGALGALSFVTPGTGISAALALNAGSAGAPVLFNAAGGAPSSITLTNGTGLPTTGLTGTLQAAQEPAHTGDVTNSAGSVALTIAANAVTLAKLATQATNTVLGNATSGTAVPTALAVGTCSTAASALIWTTNTGFGCNTSITAASVSGFTAGAGTLTGPASSGVAVTLGNNETITGIKTFSPTARSSGSASYLTINTPADTGITTATESIGENHVTATRTWVDGTVALQRERFWAGPTYNKTTTSATFTDAFNAYFTPPVAGSGVTFTRGHTLGIVDSTSAASSVTGGFIVATTLGTTATSVGIGGGNINAGGTGTFGTSVSTPSLIGTGAVTVTPASGSNLNVSLATTGDFVVNTTQFVVDTSAAKVGIGTASPGVTLDIFTSGGADQFIRDSTRTLGLSSNFTGSVAGVGTTTNHPFGLAANGAFVMTLASGGVITLNTSQYNTCAGLTTASAVLTCTVSDERVKNSINPFVGRGMAAIRKIQPITFQFNRGTPWFKDREELGLSAQNLKAANAMLASSTGNAENLLQPEPLALHAIEIDAIKQLDARLTKLENENVRLRRLLQRRRR